MWTTPWFDKSTPPVRNGVYEVWADNETGFQFWNGEWWGCWCLSADAAFANKDWESLTQYGKWRGLTTKDGK